MDKIYRYRVYHHAVNSNKAEHVVSTRADVEALIPHGEWRVVKRYQGRKRLATYSVERDIRGCVRWSRLNVN